MTRPLFVTLMGASCLIAASCASRSSISSPATNSAVVPSARAEQAAVDKAPGDNEAALEQATTKEADSNFQVFQGSGSFVGSPSPNRGKSTLVTEGGDITFNFVNGDIRDVAK